MNIRNNISNRLKRACSIILCPVAVVEGRAVHQKKNDVHGYENKQDNGQHCVANVVVECTVHKCRVRYALDEANTPKVEHDRLQQ